MIEYILREAEEKDIPQIALIHIEAMRANPSNDVFSGYMENISPDEHLGTWLEKFKNLKPLARMFVAEADGLIIGFGEVGPSVDYAVGNKTSSFYGLYILPEFQGKGVGLAIQKRGLDYLRDAGFDSVGGWIKEDNYLVTKIFSVENGWLFDGERYGFADGSNFKEIRIKKILRGEGSDSISKSGEKI